MIKLNENIVKIKKLLETVTLDLDNLTDDNFDCKLREVQYCFKEMNEIKYTLKKSFSIDTLRPYENELMGITKQIGKKFDSLIKERTEERTVIGKQLENIQNQKKLTLYDR